MRKLFFILSLLVLAVIAFGPLGTSQAEANSDILGFTGDLDPPGVIILAEDANKPMDVYVTTEKGNTTSVTQRLIEEGGVFQAGTVKCQGCHGSLITAGIPSSLYFTLSMSNTHQPALSG